MEGENPTGASGNDGGQNPPPPPATPPTTPPPTDAAKFEVKDGVMTVDGRKMVYESDLIAAKKSLEQGAEQAQTVHNTAIDNAKVELSEANQQLAAANAKLQDSEKARESGATSEEEVTRIKTDLEAATGRVGQLTTAALEFRRALLALQYQIPADQLSEKDLTQLDSFEEALKAVATSRGGPGNYATGGQGAGAVPQTNMDRAASILNATPVVGVRNPPPQQ